MRLSRSMLIVPVTLFGPLLVLALGITAGCQPYAVKPPKTGHSKTVNCDTTINVNPGAGHGVDRDVYVCDGDHVSWVAPANVTFSVQFASTAPADCPFNPCPASITDSTPQTVALPPPPNNVLTVYKYAITVTAGGSAKTYDPHVVGGGGY